ncbi:DUF1672 family protein [Mammaliicoccus sp. Dog046]|uniref:DUF1672 family protein n=1 Tax=Mammaliicoccus sp. Dog046 TaxID=3034233 RepID=UPI002B25F295|nr:DUF1672 family protein [Mammaliicoccus sp. Dog046]WQK85576.1 DUF1672 family protein [Mammaliicoccus sp. Dog046]
MNKILSLTIISILLLSGCTTEPEDHSRQATQEKSTVPEKMPVQEYKGQGYQPHAEEDVIKAAKKHRKAFEKRGEQFFKDNFGLNVKATNVVAEDASVEVYVHCNDNGIVFNASVPLLKDAYKRTSSMRSTDTSSEMEMLVGTVLSGFEYRGQKEKYDNLTQFYKDNSKKYNYTGFNKEAINKTQGIGYQNEYYYIVYSSRSLKEYRKYFEPLIHKNEQEFKEGMIRARKEMGYTADANVYSTLFTDQFNNNHKEKVKNWIRFTDNLQKQPNFPENVDILSQLGDEFISTKSANYNEKKVIEF